MTCAAPLPDPADRLARRGRDPRGAGGPISGPGRSPAGGLCRGRRGRSPAKGHRFGARARVTTRAWSQPFQGVCGSTGTLASALSSPGDPGLAQDRSSLRGGVWGSRIPRGGGAGGTGTLDPEPPPPLTPPRKGEGKTRFSFNMLEPRIAILATSRNTLNGRAPAGVAIPGALLRGPLRGHLRMRGLGGIASTRRSVVCREQRDRARLQPARTTMRRARKRGCRRRSAASRAQDSGAGRAPEPPSPKRTRPSARSSARDWVPACRGILRRTVRPRVPGRSWARRPAVFERRLGHGTMGPTSPPQAPSSVRIRYIMERKPWVRLGEGAWHANSARPIGRPTGHLGRVRRGPFPGRHRSHQNGVAATRPARRCRRVRTGRPSGGGGAIRVRAV